MRSSSIRGFLRVLKTPARSLATKSTTACAIFRQQPVGFGMQHRSLLSFKGPSSLLNTVPGTRSFIPVGSSPDDEEQKKKSVGKDTVADTNPAAPRKPNMTVAKALPRHYSELSNEVISSYTTACWKSYTAENSIKAVARRFFCS